MFKRGDRIQVTKSANNVVFARILVVDYKPETTTYTVLAIREDNAQQTVLVWNAYQNELSIRKLEGEMSIETWLSLLQIRYNQGYNQGYSDGWNMRTKREGN